MNEKSRIPRALIVLLLGGAILVACRPSQTVERQAKDVAIKASVKARLATDVGATSVTAIEVNVTNGVVTLAGPVGSEEDKQKAEASARTVEGVTGINNNLQVTLEPSVQVGTPTGSGDAPIFVPFPTPTRSP